MRRDYEMLALGQRRTVRGAQYGALIELMERTGWTYDELLAAPADLIDEMLARLSGLAAAERKRWR